MTRVPGRAAATRAAKAGVRRVPTPVLFGLAGLARRRPPRPAPVKPFPMFVGGADWQLGSRFTAADDRKRQIQGYASTSSVQAGERVDFHVSVRPGGAYTIDVWRVVADGAELVTSSGP